jgi:hypothetical protein
MDQNCPNTVQNFGPVTRKMDQNCPNTVPNFGPVKGACPKFWVKEGRDGLFSGTELDQFFLKGTVESKGQNWGKFWDRRRRISLLEGKMDGVLSLPNFGSKREKERHSPFLGQIKNWIALLAKKQSERVVLQI